MVFSNPCLPLVSDGEDPRDPRGLLYDRYVVKWNGQQYSEMRLEYWINLKKHAVDLFDFAMVGIDPNKPPTAPALNRCTSNLEKQKLLVGSTPRGVLAKSKRQNRTKTKGNKCQTSTWHLRRCTGCLNGKNNNENWGRRRGRCTIWCNMI